MRKWYDHFACETPKRDSNTLFMSIKEMLKFMTDAGAKTIAYDDEFDCWRCTDPEWVSARKKYSDMVQRQCDIWGCE